MPERFHILLTPAFDKSLERVVQYIKGDSAPKLALQHNMRFPVWQRGFSDHRIRDAADFIAPAVHWENPVRKKLVSAPQEFRCSSASGAFVPNQIPQGLEPLQKEERAISRHG